MFHFFSAVVISIFLFFNALFGAFGFFQTVSLFFICLLNSQRHCITHFSQMDILAYFSPSLWANFHSFSFPSVYLSKFLKQSQKKQVKTLSPLDSAEIQCCIKTLFQALSSKTLLSLEFLSVSPQNSPHSKCFPKLSNNENSATQGSRPREPFGRNNSWCNLPDEATKFPLFNKNG